MVRAYEVDSPLIVPSTVTAVVTNVSVSPGEAPRSDSISLAVASTSELLSANDAVAVSPGSTPETVSVVSVSRSSQ